MKTIEFKLIQDKGLQKFYKSSEILTKGLNRLTGKPYVFDKETECGGLKEEFKHLVREEGFDIVCISDAHTHAEKLAFIAIQGDDGDCFRLRGKIEGLHTMMIHGGDIDSCWDDEKYLRLIARHNGYSQNNVSIV